jgi:sulfate transport system permease protein
MKRNGILPGFGLTLGYTVTYLSLIVLLPLSALLVKATGIAPSKFLTIVTEPRVLAAFRLSFETSLLAASINAVMGTLIAWVLVRHPLPFRSLVDALIDLPFALPTAVAGIALTALTARDGFVTSLIGTRLAFTESGIVIALAFIGLPFVVRSVQPAVESIPDHLEEAAELLGASRGQTFLRVLLPRLWPAMLTGFAVAFARGLGEYGSVVFISGNMPHKTEIVPLLIVSRLEQYDYEAAATIAVLLLSLSFVSLFAINVLQKRLTPRTS